MEILVVFHSTKNSGFHFPEEWNSIFPAFAENRKTLRGLGIRKFSEISYLKFPALGFPPGISRNFGRMVRFSEIQSTISTDFFICPHFTMFRIFGCMKNAHYFMYHDQTDT